MSTLTAPRIITLPVRAAIVHPLPLLREMLVAWLLQGPRYRVVAELATGAEALARIPFLGPELVLLDPDLPDLDGERVVRALARDGATAPPIVVVGSRIDARRADSLRSAGARAVVSREIEPTSFRETLEHVVSRTRTSLRPPPRLALVAVARQDAERELTPRQLRIVAMVAAGASSREIASELGLREKTVLNHRQHIAKRLGVRGVAALTRYAIARGLARP